MEVPRNFTEIAKLNKTALNALCRQHGIRLKNGKQAKINLLCLKLGISTSGPGKENFLPREAESGLTLTQKAEFAELTPAKVESMGEWSKELDCCPDIDEGKVKQYLLDSNILTRDAAKRYKITRPFQLKPMVHSLQFNPLESSETFCLVRAQCNPSQSTSADDVKTLYCILDKLLGIPYGGYCTCTAGFCQACGHMGAMLFFLADIVSSGEHKLPADPTCTDVPCPWSSPKGAAVTPKVLREINVNKDDSPRIRTKEVSNDFKGCLQKAEEPLTYDEGVFLRLGFMNATSRLGYFPPAIHAFDPSRFKLKPNLPPMQHELPGFIMELAPELAPCAEVIVHSCMPQPLACQLDLSLMDQNVSNRIVRQGIMNSIRFSAKDRREIERGTRGQDDNVEWFRQRMGSITSSQIDEIHRSSLPGSRISTERLTSTCIGKRFKYMNKPRRANRQSLKWGTSHEDEARVEYLKWAHALEAHRNVIVYQTGLLIHPSCPYIRASPDGIIRCACCPGKRVLEIKCPYSARNMEPSKGVDSGKIDFLERENGVKCGDFKLSKTKRGYYSQVQCTMAAVGAKSCDLFVWTTKSFLVVPVAFDPTHWMSLLSSATTFFRDRIIPSIAGGSQGELDQKDDIYEEDSSQQPSIQSDQEQSTTTLITFLESNDDDDLAQIDMTVFLSAPPMQVPTTTPTPAANQPYVVTIPTTGVPVSGSQDDVLAWPIDGSKVQTSDKPRVVSVPESQKHNCATVTTVYRCCSCAKILPEEDYIADDNSDASVGCECKCGCDRWSCWLCASITEDMEREGLTWFCNLCTSICGMKV